jgi:hypothetical protein
MKNTHDAKQFHCWLVDSKSDIEKHQRLTCQYNMLHYIQQVGHKKAFNKIITLVPQKHTELFEKLMENYIHISLPTRKLTPNGNEIHQYLNDMYINGKLDPDVIDILVRRQILYLWSGNNPIHLRLLIPMCSILMKWDYSISNNTDRPDPTLTFNGQTYNPLELIKSDDLPSLDQMGDENLDKKGFVLGCVDFALDEKTHWHGIHKDYKLWLCILKLWLHTKTEYSKSLKMTLVSLIISFLKHALLDTYGETEGKHSKINICEDDYLLFLF